ncbi:MAG TPA: ParB N-terminal domain-containing protein, partial [Thermomicrobiales bacterium]|nr:ParB N-terminal domain-containing protein [Thermomicrobiales bacterium]
MTSVDSPASMAPPGASAPARPAARKGGLGRGLGALIPAAEPASGAAATLEVDIDAIAPNPYQPRVLLDPEALQTLAASIRAIGIVQPLVVA